MNVIQMRPSQLDPGAVVPQTLDNQWAPTGVLKRLIRSGLPLTSWKEREKVVRQEWRRALIYAPQVIVNRAYLFNNSVLAKDYSGTERSPFQELLGRKVIVVYLFNENSPDQQPGFDVSPDRWNQWVNLVRESDVPCVRLDWGNQEDDFRNIASAFHGYIQRLNMPEQVEHLSSTLEIASDKSTAFKQRLIEVAQFAFNKASQGRWVTRNDLYRQFVCVDDSRIDAGYYDSRKPFALELKQIFDLRYIVNLPDALGRYALTPQDSPGRIVLGDVNPMALQSLLENQQVEELIERLRRLAFATLNEALYLKGLDILSLDDVIEIRNTDEWEQYISSLRALLGSPMEFIDRVNEVAANFSDLNRRLTDLKLRRLQGSTSEVVKPLQPLVQVVLGVGAATLKFMADPGDPSRILVESLAGPVAAGFAPLAVQLVVKGTEQVNLNISIEFMRRKVRNGRDVWQELNGRLRSLPNFRFIKQQTPSIQEATQSRSEEYEEYV